MAKDRQKHEGYALNRDFAVMTLPVYFMAFFFYGPRPLLLGLAAVVTARLADRLCAMLRARRYDKSEISSVSIALILALMMPATAPFRVVAVAVLVAVLAGKEAFGGYGSYPFNPAAVGFCAAAVSWPAQVLRYPPPSNWLLSGGMGWGQLLRTWRFTDVALAEGAAMTLRNGGLPKIDFWNLLLGNYAGPMGVSCIVVVVSCAGYLLVKKRMRVWTPMFFLGTVVLIAFLFPRHTEISLATWPQDFWVRLQVVKFEVFSGANVYAAVFLLSDPVTLPRNTVSQIIYGALAGACVMMFRYFGTYELGVCFALLLVNAVSGYFDRAVAARQGRRNARRTEVSVE